MINLNKIPNNHRMIMNIKVKMKENLLKNRFSKEDQNHL
jgi:hypothetical protein